MNKKSDARDALARLMELHAEDVMATSVDDTLSEASEGAVDLPAQKARVLDLLRLAERRVGRARMDAARAGLVARKQGLPTGGRTRVIVADGTRALTLAARNGTSQSDRDKESLQSDLDELRDFESDEGLI